MSVLVETPSRRPCSSMTWRAGKAGIWAERRRAGRSLGLDRESCFVPKSKRATTEKNARSQDSSVERWRAMSRADGVDKICNQNVVPRGWRKGEALPQSSKHGGEAGSWGRRRNRGVVSIADWRRNWRGNWGFGLEGADELGKHLARGVNELRVRSGVPRRREMARWAWVSVPRVEPHTYTPAPWPS